MLLVGKNGIEYEMSERPLSPREIEVETERLYGEVATMLLDNPTFLEQSSQFEKNKIPPDNIGNHSFVIPTESDEVFDVHLNKSGRVSLAHRGLDPNGRDFVIDAVSVSRGSDDGIPGFASRAGKPNSIPASRGITDFIVKFNALAR